MDAVNKLTDGYVREERKRIGRFADRYKIPRDIVFGGRLGTDAPPAPGPRDYMTGGGADRVMQSLGLGGAPNLPGPAITAAPEAGGVPPTARVMQDLMAAGQLAAEGRTGEAIGVYNRAIGAGGGSALAPQNARATEALMAAGQLASEGQPMEAKRIRDSVTAATIDPRYMGGVGTVSGPAPGAPAPTPAPATVGYDIPRPAATGPARFATMDLSGLKAIKNPAGLSDADYDAYIARLSAIAGG